MSYIPVFFSFEGRINRARYWLASLMILCAMIFSLLSLAAICMRLHISTGPLSINLVGISASTQYSYDGGPAALLPRIATFAIQLVFGWCYAAASIKRLHDRNKSGWWIVPYLVAPGFYHQFDGRLGDSWPAVITFYATFIALIWGLVEMGWLRGTRGPNGFGRDPLAPRDSRPQWQQQDELEFAPHGAGPSPGDHVKRGHD